MGGGYQVEGGGGYQAEGVGGYQAEGVGGYQAEGVGGYQAEGLGGYQAEGVGGAMRQRGWGAIRQSGWGAIRQRGWGAIRQRGRGAIRQRRWGAIRQRGWGAIRQRGGGLSGRGVSGFRFQVDPPEAPAQLEGDPENEGLPTAIGRLTRSRPVGSRRAARGSTPRHRGLTLAGFRGGGGSAFGVGGAVGVYLRCGGGVLGVPAGSGSVRRQRARHAGVHEAPPLHALPHLVSPKEKGPSCVA